MLRCSPNHQSGTLLSSLRGPRRGTPADVRAEVRERFETLAPGGGFIFCTAHNIQPDTPLDNVLALFAACRELGRY